MAYSAVMPAAGIIQAVSTKQLDPILNAPEMGRELGGGIVQRAQTIKNSLHEE